jgi:hypothetical protein
VVSLLEEAPQNAAAVSRSTALAADERLLRLKDDRSLNYCFWLLARVTWAARSDAFVQQLGRLGIEVQAETPTLAFIASLSSQAQAEMSSYADSGPVSELASLAMRRALTETVGEQGPTLFGSTLSDLQLALRTYSTRERFGELAQRFFGDFLARTLRSYVDRELPNLVGVSAGLQSVADSAEAMQAIDRHARESALILREYSAGWYSKHNWESRGEISLDETRRFVAYALQKLRREVKREAVR